MGKYTFHDAEAHGDESLTATQILAQSSNIGTIEVAEGLGESRLLNQISPPRLRPADRPRDPRRVRGPGARCLAVDRARRSVRPRSARTTP